MINQGMILGRSSFVYRIQGTNTFVTAEQKTQHPTQQLHVDISLVTNDKLDVDGFRAWRSEFADAEFILNEEGHYLCGHEVEKMSKSKYNVQTPDELVDKYGADTLRCYEMFLGPLTQHKPWDTQGISGVHNFLRKLTRLYGSISNEAPTETQLRVLHRTIKKVTDDIDRHAFNTVVSALMIGVNELTEAKAASTEVLQPLAILVSPLAPHLAEHLWTAAGGLGLAIDAEWPVAQEKWLIQDEVELPVSFNGKVRFKMNVPAAMEASEIEALARADERTVQQVGAGTIRKVIVVPGRIVNVVVG